MDAINWPRLVFWSTLVGVLASAVLAFGAPTVIDQGASTHVAGPGVFFEGHAAAWGNSHSYSGTGAAPNTNVRRYTFTSQTAGVYRILVGCTASGYVTGTMNWSSTFGGDAGPSGTYSNTTITYTETISGKNFRVLATGVELDATGSIAIDLGNGDAGYGIFDAVAIERTGDLPEDFVDLVSSTIEDHNVTHSKIVLEWAEPLEADYFSWPWPDVTDFTFTVNGIEQTISEVGVYDGNARLLTAKVMHDDVCVLSYDHLTTDQFRTDDHTGTIGEFEELELDNEVIEDVTPPVVDGADVLGSEVRMHYDEPLLATEVPSTSSYEVTVNGTVKPITDVNIIGQVVIVTLGNSVAAGQVVKVSYFPATVGDKIVDFSGNFAAAFANLSLVNNTPGVGGQPGADGSGSGVGGPLDNTWPAEELHRMAVGGTSYGYHWSGSAQQPMATRLAMYTHVAARVGYGDALGGGMYQLHDGGLASQPPFGCNQANLYITVFFYTSSESEEEYDAWVTYGFTLGRNGFFRMTSGQVFTTTHTIGYTFTGGAMPQGVFGSLLLHPDGIPGIGPPGGGGSVEAKVRSYLQFAHDHYDDHESAVGLIPRCADAWFDPLAGGTGGGEGGSPDLEWPTNALVPERDSLESPDADDDGFPDWMDPWPSDEDNEFEYANDQTTAWFDPGGKLRSPIKIWDNVEEEFDDREFVFSIPLPVAIGGISLMPSETDGVVDIPIDFTPNTATPIGSAVYAARSVVRTLGVAFLCLWAFTSCWDIIRRI